MKILQINSVCGIRSTGRITTDLYKVIEDQGNECCIAYGRGTAPEAFHTIRIGSDLDVYKHALYTRITDNTAFASKKATQSFIDKVIQYNPDVIHLHNIHGYYINIELLFQYLREADKPVIWSLHDCWAFTGHCSHYDYIGCDKWKYGCYQCPQKTEYPSSLFCEHSTENYNRKKSLITGCHRIILVPPSKWLSEQIKDSYLNEYPCVIIPGGIDLTIFKPTENDLRRKYNLVNKYVVLGVSNGFHKYKGLNYFTALAEKLPKEYQLILIGVTPKQARLFPKNVLTLPRTDDTTQLAQFYTMADVFVNPTLQETQGLTNIEALACGTGVVTFMSGGSSECIDKSCGYVVERDDLNGLTSAIISACKEPFDRNVCLQKARLYDKSMLYKNYIKLYEASVNCLA